MIVLIGPSGAGKGTQAERIVATRPFLHVSTGDLFRENLRDRTALGRRVRRYLHRGELVPEEIVEAVIRGRLRAPGARDGFLLDGYPRTLHQATVLEEMLAGVGDTLEAVLYLKVSDREVVERRIPGRLTCEDCQRPYHETTCRPRVPGTCDVCGGKLYRRSDDTREWARTRLRVFHRQTAPVVDHYQKAGKLIVIDGEGTIDHVYEELAKVIDALERHEARPATAEESREILALREPPKVPPAGEALRRALDL
ncbi:MAG: adenylate kinase, partial [Candidatus Binatia bacterium]